jgi:hypothetical protein
LSTASGGSKYADAVTAVVDAMLALPEHGAISPVMDLVRG